jgi:hypothetical protein
MPGASLQLRVIANNIPAVQGRMPFAAAQGVGETARALRLGWQQRAHVVTGRYRSSITVNHLPSAPTAYVYTRVPYAPEEEGRPGVKLGHGPHAAMQPAVDEQRPLHPQRIADAIKRAAR